MINRLLTKYRGEGYALDTRIPGTYLFGLIVEKAFSLLYGMLRMRCFRPIMIHPSSVIRCASKIKFGRNVVIDRECFIDAMSSGGLILGDHVSIGYHTYMKLTGSLKNIGTKVTIGNNVGLGSHGYYGCGVGSLEIGDNSIFGNYVSIHPETHNYDDLGKPIREQGVFSKGGVKIGENCWIGSKATILDGTEIGSGCIVAAGAVVSGKFPDNAIIGGVPARILKMRS